METKKYFDLAIGEKIVRLVGKYTEVGERAWSRKLQEKIGTSSNRTFSDCVFFLLRNGILKTDTPREKRRRGQKRYIRLTAIGIQILKWKIVTPFLEEEVLPDVPPKRKRSVKAIHTNQENKDRKDQENQHVRWKALHFYLTRAAYGVGHNIIEPDGVHYRSELHEGVSITDLVEQRDDNFMFIDAHIRISKLEAGEIIQILLNEGIMEEISDAYSTSTGEKIYSDDARYGIRDKSLAEYVLQWGAFQNAVLSRMLYLYDSIRGPMRGIHGIESEVNWLKELVGPSREEKWLARAKDIRGKELVPYVTPSFQDIYKLDSNIQKSIRRRRVKAIHEADKRILVTLIELRRNSELRKVEEKYPVITRLVKSSVYPEFLQEIYRRVKKR